MLEEKEFRTRDISTQVYAVFERMAKDRKIDLKVEFEGPHDSNTFESSGSDGRKIFGPFGTGRVKDMIVWGDKTRILQVIINLTSNALKFTPENGSVVVTIRCVGDIEMNRKESFGSGRLASGRTSRNRVYSNTSEFSDSISERVGSIGRQSTSRSGSPPPHARELVYEFEVQDSGMGVPLHLQDKIFEPFFQGDYSLSKKYSGTGLGLSICQQLAELMRGSISLRSEEAIGSTFTMRIPLKHIASRAGSTASTDSNSRPSPRPSIDDGTTKGNQIGTTSSKDFPGSTTAATPAFDSDTQPRLVGLSAPFFATTANTADSGAEPSKLGGRKLKILIAEDNKTNQMVVLRMLRMEKIYNVDVAEDGKQALDMVKESIEKEAPYNLIFMDVQMPNMDGLEATKLIRELGFKRPIVALSAYSDDTNVKGCHDAGMDDFVSKPIQLARLRLVLKTFCPDESKTSSTTGPSTTPRSPRPLSGGYTSAARANDRKDAGLKNPPLPSTPTGTQPPPLEREQSNVSPLSTPKPPSTPPA